MTLPHTRIKGDGGDDGAVWAYSTLTVISSIPHWIIIIIIKAIRMQEIRELQANGTVDDEYSKHSSCHWIIG